MRSASIRRLIPLVVGLLLVVSICPIHTSAAEPPLTFERDIFPIFREHCFDCHGAITEVEGGLDLRLVRWMTRGGDSGPAITPKDGAASLLVKRVASGEMPPGDSHVSKEQIRTISKWIEQGAKTVRPEPDSLPPGLGVLPEERNFWSFQPITATDPPSLADNAALRARVRNPIDAFILKEMEAPSFSPDAQRHVLVNRVYLDMLGLPPTVAEMDRWTREADADWYERMVDEVLASEHYGERWARHWLDAAGYADSDGYSRDSKRPWAWRYRDWVIDALNRDLPYNEFIAQQLAGDELAGPKKGEWTEQQIRLLSATGFLRMAADGTGAGDNSEEDRNQVVADTVRIVCSSMLGLTVHCAQCHDHRYDPIPQADFYSIRAVFEPVLDPKSWQSPAQRQISLYTAEDHRRANEIEQQAKAVLDERAKRLAEYMTKALAKELEKYNEPKRTALRDAYKTAAKDRTAEQAALLKANPSVNITPGNLYQYIPESKTELKKLSDEAAKIRANKPEQQFIRAAAERPGHLPATHLFFRGDPRQPKQKVDPGGLTVAAPRGRRVVFDKDDAARPTSGRRLAFARWIASPDNPLGARVIVNRIWMHHFGRGLVKTPGDFGRLGVRPTHPELLDHLALKLIDSQWRMKSLHRYILCSTTYRQVAEPIRDGAGHSPLQYASRPFIQLEAEAIRDRMLAASGELDRTLYGKPVPVSLLDNGQSAAKSRRRSLYIEVRRTQPESFLDRFDAPVMETNCECRSVSTAATQSLALMNNDFVLAQAKALEAISRKEAHSERVSVTDLPVIPPPPRSAWQYGHGSRDRSAGATEFHHFAAFRSDTWRGGENLPDPKVGWSFVGAANGHPGDAKHASIRRWIAPAAGKISIEGKLQHHSEHGDGVRGEVWSHRKQPWLSVDAKHNAKPTSIANMDVEKGEPIDFVVNSRESVTSDSYTWTIQLTWVGADGKRRVYDAAKQFRGPQDDAQRQAAIVPSQLKRIWKRTLGRDLGADELRSLCEFVAGHVRELREDPETAGADAVQIAMTNMCHALLVCNEFLYIN